MDGNEDEEGSMQFNLKEQARDKDKVEQVKLQCSQSKQSTQIQLPSAEINAGDVGVGAIGHWNARPLIMRCNTVEIEEEICVDDVEVVVVGVVDEVTAHRLM